MAEDDIRQALLSKGWLPKELPDVFTSQDFGEHSKDILADWQAKKVFSVDVKSIGKLPGKKSRNGSYTYTVEHAEAELISKPKRGYERRNIHITHPVPQALLSHEMARHWKSIQKWLSIGIFSEDEIRVSSEYERSIKGINFASHRAKKAYLESTSDWLVKTDISRFYPTIYTHSIPWAAYGKKKVKDNLNLFKGSLGDRFDLLIRACNRNQTIGIPIGPETSRIIAEVISSRIDSQFDAAFPGFSRGAIDRLQDDWTVGVSSLEVAENILARISSLYREFGLEINGSKTAIERIIASRTNTWVSEIGSFLSHRSGPLAGARLREFLSLVLRLQIEAPSEPIINYALAVVERIIPKAGEVEALESFLLRAAVVSPGSIDRVCRIILNIEFKTKSISVKRISSRFTELAERSLRNGCHFEAIWLLYTLRGLKAPLVSKLICDQIEDVKSSAIALILLDMKSKGLCVNSLPTGNWERAFSKDTIRSDWSWLLAYEGIRHGWLKDPKNLSADPFFFPMLSRGVVFYDEKKNVLKSSAVIKAASAERKRQHVETRKLLAELRMFHIDVGFSEY